jgi:DNA-binding MarR family transcriptional regulator
MPVADAGRMLGATLTRLRRALRRGIRVDPRWEQLPMAQVELLQCLAERPGSRVGEVATALRLAPNTVSTLAGQLLERGLVDAGADAGDRRVRRLRPSSSGCEQLGQWQEAHDSMIAAALGGLSAGERSALMGALPALGALVDVLENA